jgi:hypothetical protein
VLTGRQAQVQQFAAVVDDEVELEAEEPAHARLAAPGAPCEDPARVDATVVADLQRSRVHERDAGAAAFPRLQVAAQRDEGRGTNSTKRR